MRRHEQRFRTMVEGTLDHAICLLDPGGLVATWNAAAKRVHGYRAHEILGHHYAAFFIPVERAGEKPQHHLDLAAVVGRIEEEGWRARSDGSLFWASMVLMAIRDDAGELRGFGHLMRDFSERHEAKEQLRNEERLRLMIEGVVDYAIFMLDPTGRVISWNAGAERIKGYRADEIIGEHFSRFYLPEDRDRSKPQHDLDMAAAAGRFEEEGWRVRKDGSVFWASAAVTALRDEAEGLRGFLKVTRDLTERKLANELLRASEARLLAFMNNSPSIMIIKDAGGRYLHVNQQFAHAFGLDAKRVLSRTDEEIFPAEQAAQYRANDTRVLTERKALQFEEVARYADGANHVHLVIKFPIFDGAGRLTALGGIGTDITERKQVEEEIRQLNENLERRTVQLTAANTDLESFSYSVAHDLRAPLRHVLGYAEILVEDHSDELSSAARRCLEKVSRNARQMAQLVDDLLTLAHIGRQRVTRTRTDLHALVLGVLEELAPTCAGRDIKWRIGELPSLDCDPSLMRQVYLDLLSNAIKYTIGRHPAVIEVGTNEVDAEQVLFVRDNGVGFDMKYVDKIFGVFQRLHSPEDFEGTGVGLAIVDRIIRKHGGRVWAQSEPGQGATFYFRI